MNLAERQMLDMLLKGRDEYGVVAVKAEFEAEGTRPDEFLRLLHLAHYANLQVALKIGGCEAVSDLLASRLYGVNHIIAPMVETPYALKKYVEAKDKTHGDNPEGVKFLFNLETQSTFENLDAMVAAARGNVDGVVFGRVDFTLSRAMPREAVNDPSISAAVLKAAHACRDNDLELVVGGSVSLADLPPEKWTILRVREPAIYGLKGAVEWHGRDTRQNRLSGCCERPRFGYRKERRSGRSADRWGSRSRATIAGARNMAG